MTTQPLLAASGLVERRLRLCELPITSILMLLNMNGEYSIKMEGWPEGAKVVGMKTASNPARLQLIVYHHEFPIVLGETSPRMQVVAKRVN